MTICRRQERRAGSKWRRLLIDRISQFFPPKNWRAARCGPVRLEVDEVEIAASADDEPASKAAASCSHSRSLALPRSLSLPSRWSISACAHHGLGALAAPGALSALESARPALADGMPVDQQVCPPAGERSAPAGDGDPDRLRSVRIDRSAPLI